jgi:ATP-dependent DNA ligase
VRSRRGWNMPSHVSFLEQLPVQAILDGEIVAFGSDGRPAFPLVCDAILRRHSSIPLTFIVFDVLSVEGRKVTRGPTRSAGASLKTSRSTGRSGGRRRCSMMVRRCGRRSASTS